MASVWHKVLDRFLAVMLGAKHTTSWSTGNWQLEGQRGRYFIYFTTDERIASKAEAALRQADALCTEVLDGPQVFSGPPG